MEGNRLPSGMPKPAVAEHLEILGRCFRRGGRIADADGEARAFQRHLRDPINFGRCFDADQLKERRRQIASMRKLMAELTPRHNLLRPTHDQWIADAAAMRVLLVA